MVYGEVLCFMDKSSLLIIRQIRWVGCCVETFMIFTNSSGATFFIFHFSNTVLCFQLSSGLCMFLKLAPGCFLCIPISLFFALIRLRPSVAGCHSAPCPVELQTNLREDLSFIITEKAPNTRAFSSMTVP